MPHRSEPPRKADPRPDTLGIRKASHAKERCSRVSWHPEPKGDRERRDRIEMGFGSIRPERDRPVQRLRCRDNTEAGDETASLCYISFSTDLSPSRSSFREQSGTAARSLSDE